MSYSNFSNSKTYVSDILVKIKKIRKNYRYNKLKIPKQTIVRN